jgi:plasmid stabilization system protein ParE
VKIDFSAQAHYEYLARLAELAERDLQEAEAFEIDIATALLHLVRYPYSGRLVKLTRRKAPARRWNVPPMVLFYEVRGQTLRVLRIRHGAQKPITR